MTFHAANCKTKLVVSRRLSLTKNKVGEKQIYGVTIDTCIVCVQLICSLIPATIEQQKNNETTSYSYNVTGGD